VTDRQLITEKLVRGAAATDGKTTFIRDNELIGFALRITGAGAKSFVVEARTNGKPCRYTIGPAPRFTVREARTRRQKRFFGTMDRRQ
jgi:hypothetical protein